MTKFSDIAAKWQTEYREQIAYYTYCGYVAPLKDLIKVFGEQSIASITALEIKEFIDDLVAAGKSQQTVKLRLIVFNHVFRYALVTSDVTSNPAALIKLPRNLPRGARGLPSDNDINLVKSATAAQAATDMEEMFLLLAKCVLFFGCHKGEMLAVSKYDFDFKKRHLTINKQVEFHHNQPLIKHKPKTKAGNRVIIIPELIIPELKKMCRLGTN